MVTLGMVAAISGVGGLLAANPPSWATSTEPAATARQQATQQAVELPARGSEEQAARPVSQKADAQSDAEVRLETASGEAGRAARQQRKEARQAEAEQAAADRAARKQQAVYSPEPQASGSASAPASASAVSQGS